jgi:hypothetical protein
MMRTSLGNALGAAALALTFGLAVPAARADAPAATPTRADAYLASGRSSLALGKAGAAAADLEKAVRLQPTNGYGVLWLHFARNKEGAPDSVELQINAARVNRAAWPGPLLDYLTGKIDATTALDKAGEGQDKARANRLCEADLFVGQEELTKGRRSEGLERLRAAANTCDGVSREAQLARIDLPGAPAGPKPAPTPTPVSNRLPKATLLADPTVTPASIRAASARPQPQPQTLAQAQMTPVPGDPLLRGSLR